MIYSAANCMVLGPLNSVGNPEAVRKLERATRGVLHKAERKADVQSHDSCKSYRSLGIVTVEVWLKSIENQQESKNVPE